MSNVDLPEPGPGNSVPPVEPVAPVAPVEPASPVRRGPRGGRWGTTVMSLMPFIALILFVLTGAVAGWEYSWLWFLLIPIAGIVVYGSGGSGKDRS